MPLETATYIDGLNASNPLGTGDPKSQGDDHLRLIKSAIKATFPNLTGAVTPTQTELNYVVGVTGAIQTQINEKAAANALNASNLTSGTVPDARFPATLPALSGANLTALNATNIASGSLADARLSANVPLLNTSNTFTGNNVFSASTPVLRITETDAAADEKHWLIFAGGGIMRLFTAATDAAAGSDTGVTAIVVDRTGAASISEIELNGTTLDFNGNPDISGTLTTPNASAAEVGFKGVPYNDKTDNYTLLLTDAGRCVRISFAGTKTATIPANSSVAFPIGAAIAFESVCSGGMSIAITSDTLYLAGTGFATTGTRTLAYGGVAVAIKRSATEWIISGTGLS